MQSKVRDGEGEFVYCVGILQHVKWSEQIMGGLSKHTVAQQKLTFKQIYVEIQEEKGMFIKAWIISMAMTRAWDTSQKAKDEQRRKEVH